MAINYIFCFQKIFYQLIELTGRHTTPARLLKLVIELDE